MLDELIRSASESPAREFAGVAGPTPSADLSGTTGDSARQQARPELSGRTVARLLLAAGASLVVIAVVIFTIAGWSRIGPLGRCAILLGASALVLATPRLLVRRRLTATAESVAVVGLMLTAGDAYLLQQAIPIPGAVSSPLAVAAICSVALAAAWASYGARMKLKGPLLAAIGLAQCPVPIAMASIAVGLDSALGQLAGLVAVGLVLTSAADILLASLTAARQAVGAAASVAAATTWICAILLAATAGLVLRHGWPALAWQAAALGGAALVGLAGPRRSYALARWVRPVAVVSGALAVISLAIPVNAVLPAHWGLAAVAIAGACVTLVGLRRRTKLAESAAAGSAAMLASAAALAAPVVLTAFAMPLSRFWLAPSTHVSLALRLPARSSGREALVDLALASLVAFLAPSKLRRLAWSGGLVTSALTIGLAAAELTGWAALATLTAAAAILLGVSTVLRDRTLVTVAACSGGVLAATAALWSLALPAGTIGELAALSVIFSLMAVRAQQGFAAALSTAGVLATAVGLAWAIPLTSGWPVRYAAFMALAVAVMAVAAATALRRVRPVHSVVLDLGALPVALLSAAVVTDQQDTVALVAVTVAMIAGGTAWLRTGPRQRVAVAVAGFAAMAALAVQWRALARALLAPGPVITHPWQGFSVASGTHVLPAAVVLLAGCAAALATALGALRGRGRTSLDAIAVALPLVAAPAGAAAGIGYWLLVIALAALTLALTAWAACGRSLAPAAAALVSAALTTAWALATPVATLAVLGGLTTAYAVCACVSRRAGVGVAAGCLSVVTAAALAECAVAAAHGLGWQSGLAALSVGAGVQLALAPLAGRLAGRGAPAGSGTHDGFADDAALAVEASWIRLDIGIEVAAWLVSAVGLAQCLGRAWPASLALAIAGATCLGVAARVGRRSAIWPGLALCFAAWCIALATAGIFVPEAYTGAAAGIATGIGSRASRRVPPLHSWLAHGPGLILLLVPSLILGWQGTGWIRPALVGLVAACVALRGAWLRKQAPLIVGAAVAVLDASRQLAPPVVRLVQALPGWVPIAAGGAALLWVGATYEARLRNVVRIRATLAEMD